MNINIEILSIVNFMMVSLLFALFISAEKRAKQLELELSELLLKIYNEVSISRDLYKEMQDTLKGESK